MYINHYDAKIYSILWTTVTCQKFGKVVCNDNDRWHHHTLMSWKKLLIGIYHIRSQSGYHLDKAMSIIVVQTRNDSGHLKYWKFNCWKLWKYWTPFDLAFYMFSPQSPGFDHVFYKHDTRRLVLIVLQYHTSYSGANFIHIQWRTWQLSYAFIQRLLGSIGSF